MFAVVAFYRFIKIRREELAQVREQLEQYAEANGVRGLVVLGEEGINATVSAAVDTIEGFKAFIQGLFPESGIAFKDSVAPKMPFARFKVDVRPEIVTIKNLEISASESVGTYLSPAEWHQALASDPNILVVDTRNDYETDIGVFKGAIAPNIKKFSDFKEFVEREQLPKDKKLLLYCTGGIRCEKAVPEVKRLGYDNVYQLEGGILKYLEEYPQGHFEGECFVFDHRVAVDSNLMPTTKYSLCPHCGNPSAGLVDCIECGKQGTVCLKCQVKAELHTCSKNCAYHARRKQSKSSSGSEV